MRPLFARPLARAQSPSFCATISFTAACPATSSTEVAAILAIPATSSRRARRPLLGGSGSRFGNRLAGWGRRKVRLRFKENYSILNQRKQRPSTTIHSSERNRTNTPMTPQSSARTKNKRRLIKIRTNSSIEPPNRLHQTINIYLTTAATIGLLLTSIAQMFVANRQLHISEELAQLQIAQEKPRAKISPSDRKIRFGGDKPGSYIELPTSFTVQNLRGIDSFFSIDAPILLHISDNNGETSCFIEVRGLYVQNDEIDRLDLFSPPRDDFSLLVDSLITSGIEFSYPTWHFILRYYDMFGNIQIDTYDHRLLPGEIDTRALILYNGIWSDGTGFYFDDASTPEMTCPVMSQKIRSVIDGLGGHPGELYQ